MRRLLLALLFGLLLPTTLAFGVSTSRQTDGFDGHCGRTNAFGRSVLWDRLGAIHQRQEDFDCVSRDSEHVQGDSDFPTEGTKRVDYQRTGDREIPYSLCQRRIGSLAPRNPKNVWAPNDTKGRPRSIVGRWNIRPASSKLEFGIEFTSEKKFAMTMLQSQIEGTYRLSRISLTLSYDRKNDRNEFEWIDDNQTRLTKDGQVFDCQRYDFGCPTRIVD